jgi:hypothetical protein
VLAIDVVAYPLMLWSGSSPLVKLVFYAPWTIGVKVPGGSMGTLSTGVNMGLLLLNWLIYAGLGFFLGLMLAGPRRPRSSERAGER